MKRTLLLLLLSSHIALAQNSITLPIIDTSSAQYIEKAIDDDYQHIEDVAASNDKSKKQRYQVITDHMIYLFKMLGVKSDLSKHSSLKNITVATSPDARVRWYSWDYPDRVTFGTMGRFGSFAHFKSGGKLYSFNDMTSEGVYASPSVQSCCDRGQFTYAVQNITVGDQTVYLRFSAIRYSSNGNIRMVKAFTIADDKHSSPKLKPYPLFNGKDKIKIELDNVRSIIRFGSFFHYTSGKYPIIKVPVILPKKMLDEKISLATLNAKKIFKTYYSSGDKVVKNAFFIFKFNGKSFELLPQIEITNEDNK